ncbi:MAG TPA: PilZ domain-containing protein [Kiloniellaceae bacterium]
MAASLASLANPDGQNRREWPRYRAEKSFLLAASFGSRRLPCTVADISLGGARLVFDEEVPEGETIELSHPESHAVSCARVWQGAGAVGIEFDFSEDSLALISICIREMIDLEQHHESADV